MSSNKNREITLRLLFEDNFKVARSCRKTMEAVVDVSVRYYFQNLASRRSKFALELADEIAYYGGKRPYAPSNAYEDRRNDVAEEGELFFFKRVVKLNKDSLQRYKDALSQINDGACREVLLRHKAFIESSVFEIKALKKLLVHTIGNINEVAAAH